MTLWAILTALGLLAAQLLPARWRVWATVVVAGAATLIVTCAP
ncbi:MAG TPA: hypothetical protein PLD59_00125 [Tepidisphaeraceae bacterium]|nr:hypothetical protein [Tepidisphaeraceae bacterium]